jgi:hypothetical protein
LPTQAAHKQAITESIAAIAQELQELLGQKLVAYTTDVKSPKAVGRWAHGVVEPRAEAEQRLRALYRAVLTLQEAYGPQTIRAWLQGANPDLANQAPVDVLRKGRDAAVIEAAESFIH